MTLYKCAFIDWLIDWLVSPQWAALPCRYEMDPIPSHQSSTRSKWQCRRAPPISSFFIWLICKCSHLTLILTSWQRDYDVTCRIRRQHSAGDVIVSLSRFCRNHVSATLLVLAETWDARNPELRMLTCGKLWLKSRRTLRTSLCAGPARHRRNFEERLAKRKQKSFAVWSIRLPSTDMHYGNDICYIITTSQEIKNKSYYN